MLFTLEIFDHQTFMVYSLKELKFKPRIVMNDFMDFNEKLFVKNMKWVLWEDFLVIRKTIWIKLQFLRMFIVKLSISGFYIA